MNLGYLDISQFATLKTVSNLKEGDLVFNPHGILIVYEAFCIENNYLDNSIVVKFRKGENGSHVSYKECEQVWVFNSPESAATALVEVINPFQKRKLKALVEIAIQRGVDVSQEVLDTIG